MDPFYGIICNPLPALTNHANINNVKKMYEILATMPVLTTLATILH